MQSVFTILINLLFLVIEVFFVNRIILIMIQVFDIFKRKRSAATIAISIIDALLLYYYAGDPLIYGIKHKSMTNIIGGLVFAIGVIGVFSLYLAQLYSIRLRTRREKQFKRMLEGKPRSYVLPIVITSISLLLGVLYAVYCKIYYTSDLKDDLKTSIVISLLSFLLLAYFTYLQIKANKKISETKYVNPEARVVYSRPTKALFVLDANQEIKFYTKDLDGKTGFNDLFGKNLLDSYFINNYGEVKYNEELYSFIGLKTTSFDLLDDIHMDLNLDTNLQALIPYIDKAVRKRINLDDILNANIVS